eukprot:140091_1
MYPRCTHDNLLVIASSAVPWMASSEKSIRPLPLLDLGVEPRELERRLGGKTIQDDGEEGVFAADDLLARLSDSEVIRIVIIRRHQFFTTAIKSAHSVFK